MSSPSRYMSTIRLPEGLVRLHRHALVQWHRLAPRERRLVSLAGVVLGAAFVWLVLFEPAWNSTIRLRTELPALRGQAAQLDTILAESRELRQRAGSAGAALPNQAAIVGSLARAGLQDHATVASAADGWQITLNQAPIEPVLIWLRDMPAELRLEAARAALQRPSDDNGRAATGLVSGTVQLIVPEPAQ